MKDDDPARWVNPYDFNGGYVDPANLLNWIGVMPAIDPELTEQCLDSLSVEIRQRIILVDNSTQGFATRMTGLKIEPRRNLGVARSWNIGVRQLLCNPAIDMLWLMSTSVLQHDQGNAWRAQMGQADETGLGVAHLGWHLHGFRRVVFEQVGLFDEHFYPAYWEDTDFLYRMQLEGLPCPRGNGRSWPYIFIDAGYAGDAQALKKGHVAVGPESHDYYVRKWGGEQGQERFTTPFDSDNPTSWWP